jgi:hypothetical protein
MIVVSNVDWMVGSAMFMAEFIKKPKPLARMAATNTSFPRVVAKLSSMEA